MKNVLLKGMILLCAFFFSCSIIDDTPVFNIAITDTSPSIISGFSTDSSAVVNFSITISNAGLDVSGNNSVYYMLLVTNVSGLKFSDIAGSSKVLASDMFSDFPARSARTFYVTKDLSKISLIGPNYFYAAAMVVSNNQTIAEDTGDNVKQFNSTSAICSLPLSAPYNWVSPVSAAGGLTFGTAAASTTGHWVTNAIDTNAYLMWYSFTTVANTAYYVYLDASAEGTSAYTADIKIKIYNSDHVTLLDQGNTAFFTPKIVRPSGTTLYITVTTNVSNSFGTFAIGVK